MLTSSGSSLPPRRKARTPRHRPSPQSPSTTSSEETESKSKRSMHEQPARHRSFFMPCLKPCFALPPSHHGLPAATRRKSFHHSDTPPRPRRDPLSHPKATALRKRHGRHDKICAAALTSHKITTPLPVPSCKDSLASGPPAACLFQPLSGNATAGTTKYVRQRQFAGKIPAPIPAPPPRMASPRA